MKTRNNSFLRSATLAAAIVLTSSQAVHAAALTWTGGAGDWLNGSAGGWSAAWNNANPDTGTFNGAGGTVTVKSAITTGAAALVFTAGNYTLQSDGATVRNVTLGSSSITLGTNTTTIGSNVTLSRVGSGGITGTSKTTSILNFDSGGKYTNITTAGTLTINTATVNVNTGGQIDQLTSIVVGSLTAGANLNVLGGAVNIADTATNLVLGNGAVTSTVNFKITGGALTFTNSGNNATSGAIRVGSGSGTTTGTIDLEGGTVTVNRIFEQIAGHNSTVNLHGGIIKALNSTDPTSRPEFLAVDNVWVKSGGAIFDTNGKDITVAKAMLTDVVSLGGGLTKEGLGTLTLGGANTYTGATIINGGKLAITAPYSAITATTVNNSARLKVKSSGVTPSSLGTVSVNTGGGFEFDLGTFNAANQPAVSVGTLNANGNYTVDIAGSSIPSGATITLLTYTAKTGAGLPSIGTMPPGMTLTSGPTDTGSSIQIVVNSASVPIFTWSKGDGDWDTASLNWNVNAAAYAEPAAASFPDLVEAVNGVNEVNITATRAPAAMTISNAGTYNTNAYSFTGTGAISGSTSIVKSGTGVVTFSNPNSYSGPLIITGGHVIKSAADTTSGNITVSDGCTFALSGGITDGSGQTLNLTGPGAGTTNVIAAATAIQRGSLQSISGNNTWDGNIILTGTAGIGGNTRIGTQTGASLTLTGNITEAVTGMSPLLRVGDTDTLTISGACSWTGTTRVFSNGGTLKLGGNNKLPAGSELFLGVTPGIHNFDLAGYNQTVAGLSSSTGAVIKNSGGTSTLTINPAAVKTYSGIIQDAVNVVIGGTFAQTLSGPNTYTGTTTVGSGTLALGASNALPDVSNVTIGAATLDAVTFTDTTGSLDVSSTAKINLGTGATLAFADSSNVLLTWAGALDITGTFVSGSSLRFGTTSAGLRPDQLAKITATGFTSFALDANGYLTANVVGGYAAWKTANSTSQTIDQDHDSDGVSNGTEYFLYGNVNSTGFTSLPGVTNTSGTLSVTWTKATSYTGNYLTDFVVETSSSLAAGSWSIEPLGGTVIITGNDVKYTFPAGTKNFARLKVTGP